LRPITLLLLAVSLGAASGCASFGGDLPNRPPPLADMEEPLPLQEEPDDEEARQDLPKGSFTGVYVTESGGGLDDLEQGAAGVLGDRVVENSPAHAAGLRKGDLLIEAGPADGSRPPVVLEYPSRWREVEIETEPGTRLEVKLDRAAKARVATLVTEPRFEHPGRHPADRFREEQKVGVVLRTATEVEARSAGLGPGGGAVIVGLARSSPWRWAGLSFGDLVVSVGGEDVDHPQRLLNAIRDAEPGEALVLTYVRDGQRHEVQAPVSARKSRVRKTYLPPFFSYERDRDKSDTSFLLGLFRVEETPAAWEVTLLWFIKFGGGDADRLREVER